MTDQQDTGASRAQNASEASDGRAASVQGIMDRNREHGEEGERAAIAQRLIALPDSELVARWNETEPGSELHELIAAELESRSLSF